MENPQDMLIIMSVIYKETVDDRHKVDTTMGPKFSTYVGHVICLGIAYSIRYFVY